MKRLSLIAAALLALTSAANAVEMPEKLRGEWCMERIERMPGSGFVWVKGDEGECPELVVQKGEFVQGSVTCRPLRIGPMQVKRGNTREWTVRARCIGQVRDGGREDERSTLTYRFNLRGNELRLP
jgi:hypothetical protein